MDLNPLDERTKKRVRKAAADIYADGDYDIEIYSDAPVEKVDGGYWVEAHVWVGEEDVDGQ